MKLMGSGFMEEIEVDFVNIWDL